MLSADVIFDDYLQNEKGFGKKTVVWTLVHTFTLLHHVRTKVRTTVHIINYFTTTASIPFALICWFSAGMADAMISLY